MKTDYEIKRERCRDTLETVQCWQTFSFLFEYNLHKEQGQCVLSASRTLLCTHRLTH